MNVNIVKSPLWIISAMFSALVLSLVTISIISMRKIRSFERNSEGNHNKVDIQIGVKTFTKRRFAWVYSPDRLESWLESMALNGAHLVKVSRYGSKFYFIHGAAKKVAYVADYQLKSDPDYFQFHKDNGWNHIFSTPSSITKWTIWSKEYANNEERPELYYDRQHIIAHAKKVFFINIGLNLFLLAINTFNLSMLFISSSLNQLNNINIFSFTCLLLSNIMVIIMGTKSGLYYSRIRKQQIS